MYYSFETDLRKLIKYEEPLGIKLNQPDYFHSLWQRTTNSFRAKTDKENASTKRNSKDASVKQVENAAAATSGAHKKTSSTVVQKTRPVLGEQNQLTASRNKPRQSPANQPKQPALYKNTQTNTNSTNTISSTTYKDILIDKEKSKQKKPHGIEKTITSKQTTGDFVHNEQRPSQYKESNREHRDNKTKAPTGEKPTDDWNAVKKVHNRNVGPSTENRTATVTDRDKHRVELNTRHINEVGDVNSKTGITRKLRNPVNLPEWEPDQYTTRSRTKPISEVGTFGAYSGSTASK